MPAAATEEDHDRTIAALLSGTTYGEENAPGMMSDLDGTGNIHAYGVGAVAAAMSQGDTGTHARTSGGAGRAANGGALPAQGTNGGAKYVLNAENGTMSITMQSSSEVGSFGMRGHQMKARSLPSSSCPSSEAAESVHTRTIKRAGTTFTARMPSATTANGCEAAHVVRDFMDALDENEDLAVAVAAIRALTAVIERSSASTMHGIERELRGASEALKGCSPCAISLSAGCELFMRFVTRTTTLESEDFEVSKERLIERGRKFEQLSLDCRANIADLGARFISEGSCVLVHGYSRVVISLLRRAAMTGRRFSVIVTEGRPDAAGVDVAKKLRMAIVSKKKGSPRTANSGIPVTMVLDSCVGHVMDQVDMVIVGAEGVVESGGIINKLGTFQIATVAKALGKPVYVAAESYKFARFYPLSQSDFPCESEDVTFHVSCQLRPKVHNSSSPQSSARQQRQRHSGNAADAALEDYSWLDDVPVVNPSRDYTPPQAITLLFTDLGVLTPSAVSDELIQLYL